MRWAELVTFLPLATLCGASLGLAIGTRVEPRQVPLMFSVIIIPLTFLGATYYPWARLTPIAWLKTLVLINPLVYMSEAFRAALTPQFPHMATTAIYLECDDLDQRVEQLARSGIAFEHGPRNQPWMWREARLRDPDGNIIFLYKAGEARRFPPWRMQE